MGDPAKDKEEAAQMVAVALAKMLRETGVPIPTQGEMAAMIAMDRAAQAKAELAEAVVLLRAAERVFVCGDESTLDSYKCAVCGAEDVPGRTDGMKHLPDCKLAALLTRHP